MLKVSTIFMTFFILLVSSSNIWGQSNNSDNKALEVIMKSIEFHGGMESYESLEQFDYLKTSWRFDSLEVIKDTTIQTIHYDLRNNLRGYVDWKRDTLEYRYLCEDTCARYKQNIIDVIYPSSAAKRTLSSSHYVLFMPFKLLDPGVELSLLENDILEDKMEVFVVEAIYEKDKEGHDASHIWHYYFNAETYRLEGGLVNQNGRFSYIRNNSFDRSQGLLLHAKRSSFKVDSLRNIEALRVGYLYEYNK